MRCLVSAEVMPGHDIPEDGVLHEFAKDLRVSLPEHDREPSDLKV